jgi:NADH dehydrogenase
VEDYDGETVRLNSGKTIPARTLIWAAGVMGETIQGTDRWTVRGNRLRVDQFNRLQGWENIFAIGDVAYMESDEAYATGHPMVAQVAMQQGKLLAHNLMSLHFGRKMKPFSYQDKGSMATIGRNKAVADIGKMKLAGRLAWLMWMGVHLFSLAGFRNKLVVFINWFWSYVTYDRGTRLIIRPFRGKQNAATLPAPQSEEKAFSSVS